MKLFIDGNNWYSADFFGGGEENCNRYFINRVKELDRAHKFDEIVVAFDSPNTFRRKLYPAYKAGSGEKPIGYRETLELLKTELQEGDWTIVSHEGLEADDVISIMVNEQVKRFQKCVIASSDKDLHQCLLTDFVCQATKFTRDPDDRLIGAYLTAAGLEDKYGVRVSQWIDYRTIVGDSSDNIPGCAGVGAKGARTVLQACDTLEEFWANPLAVRLPPKQHAALCNFQVEARLYRELITLKKEW